MKIAFGLFLLILSCFFFHWLFVSPANMDEFLAFHALACEAFPNSLHHSFVQACTGTYDLLVLDKIWLPLRSYIYTGSTPALLYWPLHAIWPKAESVIFFGLLQLSLLTLILREYLKISSLVAWTVIALFFPLSYQMLHDTGPLTLQLIAMGLCFYLTRLILQWPFWRSVLPSVFLGVAVFFAFEEKPFFVTIVPSLVFAVFFLEKEVRTKKFFKLFLSVFVFSVLATILLTAKSRFGTTYLFELTANSKNESIGGQEWLLHIFDLWNRFFLHFENFSHRVYEFAINKVSLPTLAFWMFYLLVIGFGIFKIPTLRKQIFIYLSAGVICALMVMTPKHAWAGHHVIFPFVFFLSPLALVLQSIYQKNLKWGLSLLTLLALLQVSVAYPALHRIPMFHSNFERDVALDYLSDPKLTEKYFITHLDWGTYYKGALFGPKDQTVTYNYVTDTYGIQALIDRAKEFQKGILFLCLHQTCAKLNYWKNQFRGLKQIPVNGIGPTWVIWQADF